MRTVPGHEFSGVIAAVGKDVQDFQVGDEVYGMNDWFADGATAEFCIALPQNIARKPATLSHEAAASVPIGALTSWQGLIDRAKLESGERVNDQQITSETLISSRQFFGPSVFSTPC